MIIERGTLKQYAEELRPMFQEHWDEIGMAGSHDLKLDICEEHYERVEQSGRYLAIALKTDEGKLIGYLSIFVYGHPHHQNTNFAVVDCFMIKKGYRNLNGFKSILKMFKLAEELLVKEFNVEYFQFCYSVNNPLKVLADRMGFVESDVMGLKKLNRKG